MTTINATLFKNLVGDQSTGFTATIAEQVIDQAIDWLNTYGAGISNLGGAAGSKSGTYTGQEPGAIIRVATIVYHSMYKSQPGFSMGDQSLTPWNMTARSFEGEVKLLAQQVQDRSFQRT